MTTYETGNVSSLYLADSWLTLSVRHNKLEWLPVCYGGCFTHCLATRQPHSLFHRTRICEYLQQNGSQAIKRRLLSILFAFNSLASYIELFFGASVSYTTKAISKVCIIANKSSITIQYYTHTHTHTHTHTQSHTRARIDRRAQAHIPPFTHAGTHTHVRKQTHAPTHTTHTDTHASTHLCEHAAHTHARTHAHTHTHARTHTYTHTHTTHTSETRKDRGAGHSERERDTETER